jgi:hypothetical protein
MQMSFGSERAQTFQASVAPHPKGSAGLIERVAVACKRLASFGWADLLALHGLDIRAADLAAELARELKTIDRTQPGFEDFAWEGLRAIEPGRPSHSLLFHAFASPEVTHFRGTKGRMDLKEFPVLAEIEAVENYVYGALLPSIEDLRAAAHGAPLAIVAFASEYRPAVDTVHRRHADMCYARTGVARLGTRKANFQPAARGFLPCVASDGHVVSVQPCRYAAYIAALKPGAKGIHGPLQFVEPRPQARGGQTRRSEKNAGLRPPPTALRDEGVSDADRQFWLPLHKLFDGEECLRGYSIDVRLAAQHINEKIRRAHLYFGANGHDGGWREPDISQSPFIIQSGIAEFSVDAADGSWLLTPIVHPRLIEPAEYEGNPLTYIVPKSTEGTRWRNYQSSLNLRPASSGARAAPEYLHARHAVTSTGEENLNNGPDLIAKVRAGGYRARHYVDFTGDGWIDVECGALALEIPRRLPAYSIVASPDYFPLIRQSDLITWTDQSVPPSLLANVWPVNPGRPEPLSSQRYAANLELKQAGFDRDDDTMTAIVGPCGSGVGKQTQLRVSTYARASMLPDGAAGVFSPGWDVSYDRTSENDPGDNGAKLDPGVTFLNNYGLGSPFPEDSMLCAALSSFWPAVAPDVTRTFAPNPRYATATPLTDEVIGLNAAPPWDGIRGPIPGPSSNSIDYKALAYGDYVEAALIARFDMSTISQTSVSEYIARTLTMAMVYAALDVTDRLEKAKWSVLSFRPADPKDPDLLTATAAHGRRLDAQHTYRYEMIRHDGMQAPHPDPKKFDRVVVTYLERVLMFADPTIVLRRGDDGKWARPYERSR